jgi:myosin heavy subunit
MTPKETLEKEIRALEATLRNLRIKKSNEEKEVNSLENKKINIIGSINELEQRKTQVKDEFSKEHTILEDLRREKKVIKKDIEDEASRLKEEWIDFSKQEADLQEEIKKIEGMKDINVKEAIALKEKGRTLLTRQSQLDQLEASLKSQKKEQDDREKELDKASVDVKERDLASIKDNSDLKIEAERLANIAKSLESKKQDFEKTNNALEQRSKDLDVSKKDIAKLSDETDRLKIVLSDKIKETEESKKRYDNAYANLSNKEKEFRVKELRFIKLSKEKLTEETLKKLEEELKKEDNA